MEYTVSPITHPARRSLSRIGLAYFLFFAVSYGGQILLLMLFGRLAPGFLSGLLGTWLLSLLPMYAMALPIFYLLLRPLPQVATQKRRLRPRHLLLFFFIAYAVLYISNLIGLLINLLTEAATGVSSSSGAVEIIESSPLGYTLLFAVLLGPALEELMFRRLILSRLLPFGEGFAILGSSLLFALFHANLAQFFYAFAVGVVLAYVTVVTGRLRYSVTLHCAINFCGSILPLLLLRGVSLEMPEGEWTLEVILEMFPSLLLLLAYLGTVVIGVAIGLFLIGFTLRRVRLAPAPVPIPRGEWRHLLLSPGMLLLALTVLATFFLSYL